MPGYRFGPLRATLEVQHPPPPPVSISVVHVFAIIGPDAAGETSYLWDGSGDFLYDGNTYQGTEGAIGVSPSTSALGGSDQRLTVSIPLIGLAARMAAIENRGPTPASLAWLVSTDGGATYSPTPRRFMGRVSGPRILDEVLFVELETWLGDADRSIVRNWSDEDQQRRYPGDKGLANARTISEGIESSWPP